MFEMLLLNIRFYQGVIQQESDHPPSARTGKDHCSQSGCCCWRAPGELSPEDLNRLANHHGLTKSGFFKTYCVVDTHYRTGNLIIRLRRAHQSEIAGTMLSNRETYSIDSPCVFLTADRTCGVHEVKPRNCATFKCWSLGPEEEVSADIHEWTRDALLDLGWDGISLDG